MAFAVNSLAIIFHAPTDRHVALLLKLLRYLSGSRHLGFNNVTEKSENKAEHKDIVIVVNADWAGDKTSRKPTTGFVVLWKKGPIFWQSQKQSTVALSSAEAEYIAIFSTAK